MHRMARRYLAKRDYINVLDSVTERDAISVILLSMFSITSFIENIHNPLRFSLETSRSTIWDCASPKHPLTPKNHSQQTPNHPSPQLCRQATSSSAAQAPTLAVGVALTTPPTTQPSNGVTVGAATSRLGIIVFAAIPPPVHKDFFIPHLRSDLRGSTCTLSNPHWQGGTAEYTDLSV